MGKRPVRRWSLARRLALLHIAAVLISYALFGILFYSQQTSLQEAATRRGLIDEIDGVRSMLREPDGIELLGAELRTQVFEPDDVRPFLRVLDRQGRVVRESPGMDRIIPRDAFLKKPDPDAMGIWKNGKGDSFLVRSVPLDDNPLTGSHGVLQIGMSARGEQQISNELRYTLLVFVAGGLAFSFICAYVIIRLGLLPLEKISRTARSITRRELHTRIDEAALPVELLSLAGSFNSMLARLEDSFDRLSHYSANLAHELRTPINTLMIAADISLSRERGPEEYRSVLASSLEEFERLSWTIDRMLFLARADVEQHNLSLQCLEVAGEIENLFDYFSEAANEAGVGLGSSGTASVYADQTLFRRALSNLIGNALAHTPRGGAIAITVRRTAERSTEVVVRDNGCGIRAEHLSKIFDRFYRVPGAKSVEGTGLGLAIVKAIMQMHGGEVSVESREGDGTQVSLHFPPPPDA